MKSKNYNNLLKTGRNNHYCANMPIMYSIHLCESLNREDLMTTCKPIKQVKNVVIIPKVHYKNRCMSTCINIYIKTKDSDKDDDSDL